MKFGPLPIGTRFDYEGVRYLKTGPLLATREDGGQQRFLGRYADVRVLTAVVADATGEASADWRTAFDAFYTECLQAIAGLAADDASAAARARDQLEAARRRLFDRVGNDDQPESSA